jgi:hypothetical protein
MVHKASRRHLTTETEVQSQVNLYESYGRLSFLSINI